MLPNCSWRPAITPMMPRIGARPVDHRFTASTRRRRVAAPGKATKIDVPWARAALEDRVDTGARTPAARAGDAFRGLHYYLVDARYSARGALASGRLTASVRRWRSDHGCCWMTGSAHRSAPRRVRRADRDARQAARPHHHAQSGREHRPAPSPSARGAGDHQGRHDRSEHRRAEAGWRGPGSIIFFAVNETRT